MREWEKLTSDPEILRAIRGDVIDFVKFPPVNHEARPCAVADELKMKIETEIQSMLSNKIIKVSQREENEYVSPIFSVPKPDDGTRVILNLKRLNQFVEYHHFKMDNIRTVLASVTPGCFMASIDLKGAYHSVKIAEDFQKYLKFYWNGQLYQFTCYPNGLARIPRKFTKIMKAPLSCLRSQGHFIIGYIDDFFLKGNSGPQCVASLVEAARLLERLGFTIHPTKSKLLPETKMVFLGFLIDSVAMTVTLTDDKRTALVALIDAILHRLQQNGSIKIEVVASLVGKIVSSLPGSLFGALYYRALEADKNGALRRTGGNYEGFMTLSDNAMRDVMWWKENLPTMFAPIRWPPITAEMSTDASGKGWGASFNCTSIGGSWTVAESDLHINVLEMLAILYALRSFQTDLASQHVRVLCDNSVSVSVINKMGTCRSPECNYMAQKIWAFCQDQDIFLTCAHIPGVENVLADAASRREYKQGEWMLHKSIFERAVAHFQFHVDIDCFATRLNAQHAKYCSRYPDPFATHIDGFSFNWGTKNCFVFPPFSVIQRVIQKVQIDQATVLAVFPHWTTQAWWPDLQHLLVGEPLLIPPSALNLILPGHPTEIHPLCTKLGFVICLISAKSTKLGVTQNPPLISC